MRGCVKEPENDVIYQSVESKNEFSGCWYNHELLLPFVQERVQYGSETRAPVPMTWAFMMREAGFPAVRPIYELPLSEDVLDEVREEMRSLGSYIAFNLEGSSQERTFSLSIAENLIAKI